MKTKTAGVRVLQITSDAAYAKKREATSAEHRRKT